MAKVKRIEVVETDEHAHDLAGTLGMTIGGVAAGVAAGAAAGATTGAVGGPVGAVIGAAIGGAIGGKAGEAVAREINPTYEETYWRENFAARPYVDEDAAFEDYWPAYRYGVDAFTAHAGQDFTEIEPSLGERWEDVRGDSSLEWNEARHATRDAYGRLYTQKR